MSEFKREHRYWVFKRNHLSVREDDQMQSLAMQLEPESCPGCVVVEDDWSEYEIVWDLIRSRVENRPNRIEKLDQQLAALREAAGELVANAEWDGDISTVDTGDLKALRAELLQETPHD